MTADVIIIGGGIVGASIAYCLGLKKPRGFKAVLLEKEALCSGSTNKSLGLIRLQHSARVEIQLIQRTLEMIRVRGEASELRFDFKKIGFVYSCRRDEEADRLRQDFTLKKAAGVQVHWLERQDLIEIIPQLTVGDVSGAAFTPENGYLDPYLLTTALAKQARNAGVEIEVGTEVKAVVVEKERVSKGGDNQQGEDPSPHRDQRGGALGRDHCKHGGFNHAHQTHQGPDTCRQAQNEAYPGCSHDLGYEHRFLFWEETGGLLLLGKLDKAFDVDRGHINPDDYYEFKEKHDDEFKDFVIERVNERLPSFNGSQLVRGRVGLRTVTPDCLPILGETEVKGFLCAIGFSGTGIQLGPATGQIIADFILNQTPSPYLEILSLQRFI